ncbi:hypothetical protein C2S51_024077 [Perilla frutescens var. frutescens]|nr:hypothetical protein C2S51_024077 [Perilla frutescens var. frutescens]
MQPVGKWDTLSADKIDEKCQSSTVEFSDIVGEIMVEKSCISTITHFCSRSWQARTHTLSLSKAKEWKEQQLLQLKFLFKISSTFTKEEISLIQGLDIDAEKLKTNLKMIQSYLKDAETKLITQETVKTWLQELEAVAFRDDNALDELKYHLLHKEVNKMKPKVKSFFSSFDYIARRNMALTIKQINEDFDNLKQDASNLHLESVFMSAPAAVPDAAFETDSLALDPIFIGRDADAPKLVEMLTHCPEERMISVVAIVGMDERVQEETDGVEKLKKSFKAKHDGRGVISENLKKSFKAKPADEGATREVILKNLQKAMKAKTYLLVLDDVWNQDLQKWGDFMNSFSGVTSTNGNGIIITTRIAEVAQIANPFYIHRLNRLSDEDCWSIIKAKAFPSTDIVPSHFDKIGGKIAGRCQGLPLAANVVGGLLLNKSKQEWRAIQEEWLSVDDGDNISKILRLSYDNLSSQLLKKCFAYCSIFPKGERIVKQELIELWMAEEFLQADRGNDMESVGIKFLNVLLQNSLLQVAERDDYGNVRICVMYDLVHDLACSILGSSNNPNGHQRYRCESCPISKEEAKHVRTLFFKGDNISHVKFSDFKCLHAVTLSSSKVKELPSSIKKLIHLKNLNIEKTWIRYLPNSIGELHHLQTLRADVWKLPSTTKYLISLRHLFVGDHTELFREIGRLTSLQTLTHFRVGKGCQIDELGSLENLKGKIKISCLEKVRSKEEAEKANMFQKPNLFELSFKWGWRREGEVRNDKNVLDGLQPHPNLKKLEISGFKGKGFPLWTLKMAVRDDLRGSWVGLNKLVEITLSECKECEELPALGQLPNLKSLYLESFHKLKSINSSFYGADNEINIVFPALKRLTLSNMFELREWEEVEFGSAKVFPHLQYLMIYKCNQLMSVPSYFSSLTELFIRGLDGMECLPDWLFHNNQDLKKVTIERCKKLRKLPDGLDTLKSLEELIIDGCPDMTSIGYPSAAGQSHGVLRTLLIEDCRGLMDLPPDMIESWAPSLERLTLERLNSLKNLPVVIDCLAKSAHRLTELRIFGVQEFMATCSVENWPFRSLRELEIGVSMGRLREHSVAVKKTVDGILLACSHSLVRLRLYGMEIWEYLPESIQNLTALSQLELRDFGIEELPEWIGNLSSLERWCPKLRIDSKWRNKPHLSISVNYCQLEPSSEKKLNPLEACLVPCVE